MPRLTCCRSRAFSTSCFANASAPSSIWNRPGGLHLQSRRLGLAGRADVVEFRRVGATEKGGRLPGLENHWRPFPVEYKRGQSKQIDCDRVQLCAQALCLEEMLRFRSPPARCSTVRFVDARRSSSTRTCATSRSGPRADFTTSWRVARRRSSIANRSAVVVLCLRSVFLPESEHVGQSVAISKMRSRRLPGETSP